MELWDYITKSASLLNWAFTLGVLYFLHKAGIISFGKFGKKSNGKDKAETRKPYQQPDVNDGIKRIETKLDKLDERIERIEDQSDKLVEWHAPEIEPGIKIWWLTKSFQEAVKEMAALLRQIVPVMESIKTEIKRLNSK